MEKGMLILVVFQTRDPVQQATAPNRTGKPRQNKEFHALARLLAMFSSRLTHGILTLRNSTLFFRDVDWDVTQEAFLPCC